VVAASGSEKRNTNAINEYPQHHPAPGWNEQMGFIPEGPTVPQSVEEGSSGAKWFQLGLGLGPVLYSLDMVIQIQTPVLC
jgi:hypothetical protein